EYTDANGSKQAIDVAAIVKAHETQTTLVHNNDGTYTYTSEDGTTAIINVPADVIQEFETIISNEAVKNKVVELIAQNGGNMYYDGTKFEYTDANGSKQAIDVAAIVKAHETLTVLNFTAASGSLTYKDEEGNTTTVDVQAAVKAFETKTSITSDATTGTVTFTAEDGLDTVLEIAPVIKAHETVTKLVNNQNGSLTFYNENEIDETGAPIVNTGLTFKVPTFQSYELTNVLTGGPSTEEESLWTHEQFNVRQAFASTNYFKEVDLPTETIYINTFDLTGELDASKYMNFAFSLECTTLTVGSKNTVRKTIAIMNADIYINGVLVKKFFPARYTFGVPDGFDRNFIHSYSGIYTFSDNLNLLPTGNVLEIRVSPRNSNFRDNEGGPTDEGYFDLSTPNVNVLEVKVLDPVFHIFEKK
ncbi:hypothetical protein H4K35_15475, partial [Myroides sp. NP-2]|nr:hypothetical protein [Myroides sp. NP-2]